MISGRLPLDTPRRQQLRDDRLWSRELHRARLLNFKHLHCPCTKCRDRVQVLIKTVRLYLLRHGRHLLFRVWRGLRDRDSSDEDWEEEFWRPTAASHAKMDVQVDTREMLNDAFQVTDDPIDIEERAREEVLAAFTVADVVHKEYSHGPYTSGDDDVASGRLGEPIGDTTTADEGNDGNFDPKPLEEALQHLYPGARSTKHAATIVLMNLCTVHRVSNSFANEMFAILHAHLLPKQNCLPKNYHAARCLTQKLGSSYNSIHACKRAAFCFSENMRRL
jgi:hypothetical protein